MLITEISLTWSTFLKFGKNCKRFSLISKPNLSASNMVCYFWNASRTCPTTFSCKWCTYTLHIAPSHFLCLRGSQLTEEGLALMFSSEAFAAFIRFLWHKCSKKNNVTLEASTVFPLSKKNCTYIFNDTWMLMSGKQYVYRCGSVCSWPRKLKYFKIRSKSETWHVFWKC